ncbi:hypothetical protein ACQKNX_08175 [Lysinibacillus sp. NPDC093712]|uniref:hypothetical protein n=1 Tax=Lysinibacillus sp. NPDC093712 TaxID=3390579 RepID=UPI003CFE09BF
MAWKTDKLDELFTLVLNEKESTETEEVELKRYINEVFGGGMPSQHELHQFNNLVVKRADEIARPKATEILSLLADMQNAGGVSVFQYTIPKEHKIKAIWSANGSSVDHVRVEGDETRTASPTSLQTGVYYEVKSLVAEDVEYFRKLVNNVAEAKVRLYWDTISKLFTEAVANGDIPTANVVNGANLTLAQYNKLVSTIGRIGNGQSVFIADTALIDHFAFQQATDNTFSKILTEDLKSELAHSLNIARIGRSTAVSLVNPFVTGSKNTVTELPVNEGYMFAGGVGLKPFKIIEFGALEQYTDFDHKLKRVEINLNQEVAIEFVQGDAVGYVKDTALTL